MMFINSVLAVLLLYFKVEVKGTGRCCEGGFIKSIRTIFLIFL